MSTTSGFVGFGSSLRNRKFDTVAQSYEKDFLISNCIEFLMCIFHFSPNSIIEGRLITIIYLYKCKLCFLDVRLGFTTAKQHFSWPSPNIVFIPHHMVIPLTLIIKMNMASSRSGSDTVSSAFYSADAKQHFS